MAQQAGLKKLGGTNGWVLLTHASMRQRRGTGQPRALFCMRRAVSSSRRVKNDSNCSLGSTLLQGEQASHSAAQQQPFVVPDEELHSFLAHPNAFMLKVMLPPPACRMDLHGSTRRPDHTRQLATSSLAVGRVDALRQLRLLGLALLQVAPRALHKPLRPHCPARMYGDGR